MNPKVSQFDGIKPHPLQVQPTIEQVFEYIKTDGRLKDDTQSAREALRRDISANSRNDKGKLLTPEYDALKIKFPGVTWGGTFTNRQNSALVQASGLLSFDIDFDKYQPVIDYKKEQQQTQELFARLSQDKYVAGGEISLSDIGIKGLVKIPLVKNDAEYKAYFRAFQAYLRDTYGIKLDSLPDISRLCFLASCLNAFWYPEKSLFERKAGAQASTSPKTAQYEGASHDNGLRAALEILQKTGIPDEIGRNEFVGLCGAFKHEDIDYETFDTIMQKTAGYDADENWKIWNSVKDASHEGNKTTAGTIVNYAKGSDPDAYKAAIASLHPKPPHPADTYTPPADPRGPSPEIDNALPIDEGPQEAPPIEGTSAEKPEQAETKKLPAWAFWREDFRNGKFSIELMPFSYLQFLESAGFRVFNKRGDIVIVQEIDDRMEYTQMRGRINSTVKQYVLEALHHEGLQYVADMLIVNSKFFTLDILDQLKDVDQAKAQHSIFSEVPTEILLNTQVEEERPVLTFHFEDGEKTVLLSTDNLMAISAKSGVGKSQICELIASLAIAPDCEPLSPLSVNLPNEGRLIWYDTERSKGDCFNTLQRIYNRVNAQSKPHLLNDDKTGFRRLEIRGLKGIEDHMTFVLEHLEAQREPVALVILDGALDLVTAMNDETQAKALASDIERITKKLNCGCLVTIHAKKGEFSGAGLGHVGQQLWRKSTAFLTIQKIIENGREIKRMTTDFDDGKVRNGRDFGIDIFFEYDGIPHFIDYELQQPKTRSEQLQADVKAVLEAILAGTKGMRFTDLRNAYMEARDVNESKAKSHIEKAAKKWGILSKDGHLYRLDSDPF